MALRKANEIVSEVMENVEAPIDEEGVQVHSTDDDLPKIERITVEPVEGDFMDSPLVKGLRDLTRAIDKLR
tara:strand:- start:267 stop:479 length:213 start_codon:yes stop_codon:yes gene_type:complete